MTGTAEKQFTSHSLKIHLKFATKNWELLRIIDLSGLFR